MVEEVKLDPSRTPPGPGPYMYDGLDAFMGVLPDSIQKDISESKLFGSFFSCGVTMLSGLSGKTPKQIVDKVLVERAAGEYKTIREAFVVWSDTDYSSGGKGLFAYIRDNKLGEVVQMGPRMNPNTGNMISIWVWAPPHKSLMPADRQMPIYGKTWIPSGNNGGHYLDKPRGWQDMERAATLKASIEAKAAQGISGPTASDPRFADARGTREA